MAGKLQETADNVLKHIYSITDRCIRYDAQIRAKLSPTQHRLFEAFLFLLIFTVLAAPFYLILNSGWDATWLQVLNATVVSSILSHLGLGTTSSGSFISGAHIVLNITRDCTGWKSVLAFTALVLASRKGVQRTVQGLALGVLTIFLANILRLVTTYYAVVVYHINYEFLHLFLWRWGLTLVVFTTWLVWATGRKPSINTFYRPFTAPLKNDI